MPSVRLSSPLAPDYADHLGLAARTYAVGEVIVVGIELSQFLEFTGYGVVVGEPASGAPLLFGNGAPSAGLGANGSYYLDVTTGAQRVYGPKTNDSWGAGAPLAGSTTLLGGLTVLPAGPKGDKGDKGDSGGGGSTPTAIRSAPDYDDTTAPSTGVVIRWNGSKYAPAALTASGVGAVALTGAETIAGVKTFSSSPIIPAAAGSTSAVRSDDARMTNARTPTSHASTHGSGGSDPVTPANIGASPSTHTHTASSVGAAAATHTHSVADIVGSPRPVVDWGSGTAFPTSGMQQGDVYRHNNWGLHVYDGAAWTQSQSHLAITQSQRSALPTTVNGFTLHNGFRVYETDTFREYNWNNNVWKAIAGGAGAITPALADPFTTFGSWRSFHYWREADTVHVSGIIAVMSGRTVASNSEIPISAALPVDYRPVGDIMGSALVNSTGVCRMDYAPSGIIEVVASNGAIGAGSFIAFERFWSVT